MSHRGSSVGPIRSPGSRRARGWLLVAWLALAAVAGPIAAAEEAVDLRVLVDVSGSMKKNDPRNLRAPALRLLVGLLPETATAGIWTFGERVTEAVPVGPVDRLWQARGRRAASRIRSDELYTDIEQALKTATADWTEPAADGRRYVILLTDGMVDVGRDGAGSADSRRRIREELLPRLADTGVTVHTIALSPNADRPLLEALARATDGWSEQVDSAEALNRVFLSLFEKTAPPATVPIDEGNRFTVDEHISDMTLLVFRSGGGLSSKVVTPAGAVLSALNPLPDNVRWQEEQGYDLVTVTGPEPGRWRIDAEVDPDNRVMVVTNLKLEVNELPNHVLQDTPIPVVARLLQEGGRVTAESFLELVDFHAAAGREGARPETLAMEGAEKPGDYTVTVRPGSGPGILAIEVVADGGTFARRHLHEVKVHDEPGTIELTVDELNGRALLEATLAEGLMDLDTARLSYRALDGDQLEPVSVEPGQPGVWQARLPGELAGRMVEVRLEAKQVDGEHYALAVEQLVPGTPPPLPPLPEKEPPAPAEEAPPFDWPMVWVWVGAANLVLWPLAGLGWWGWRRQQARRRQAIEEALTG